MAAIPKRECAMAGSWRPGPLAGLEVMRPRRVHEAHLHPQAGLSLYCSCPLPLLLYFLAAHCRLLLSLCCCCCSFVVWPPARRPTTPVSSALTRSHQLGARFFGRSSYRCPIWTLWGDRVSQPSIPAVQPRVLRLPPFCNSNSNSALDPHPRHAHDALTTRRSVPPCIRPGTCRQRTTRAGAGAGGPTNTIDAVGRP